MRRKMSRHRAGDSGFTLIELLVVVAILGILAGIVVFAVSNLGDKGQANACKIDTRTIRTAEEAYFSRVGNYGTEAELTGDPNLDHKFLSELSTLHNITPADPDQSYNVTIQDAKCGTVPNIVGATADDY